MKDIADHAATLETGALIDHILARYHAAHRAGPAMLRPLAGKVEAVHGDDPDAPAGLAVAPGILADRLEETMAREEQIRFPPMRVAGMPGIGHTPALVRASQPVLDGAVARVRRIVGDATPPGQACGSWRARLAATATLLDDLARHEAPGDGVLFPRFRPAARTPEEP